LLQNVYYGILVTGCLLRDVCYERVTAVLDLSFDNNNNNNNNNKENRIKTKTKKEINILTKQKLRFN